MVCGGGGRPDARKRPTTKRKHRTHTREVWSVWNLVLVTSNVVPCCHNTDTHVVEAELWDGSVEDSDGQVGPPERVSTVEALVSGHSHIKAFLRSALAAPGWLWMVQTCKGTADTTVLSTPVTHDETLETELGFEELVENLTVLACIGVVDLVVGAHDTGGTSADGVGKRPCNISTGSSLGGNDITDQRYSSCIVTSSMLDEMASIGVPSGRLLGCLKCSCSLRIKCLVEAMMPEDCMPWTVSATAIPDKTGSGEKPVSMVRDVSLEVSYRMTNLPSYVHPRDFCQWGQRLVPIGCPHLWPCAQRPCRHRAGESSSGPR